MTIKGPLSTFMADFGGTGSHSWCICFRPKGPCTSDSSGLFHNQWKPLLNAWSCPTALNPFVESFCPLGLSFPRTFGHARHKTAIPRSPKSRLSGEIQRPGCHGKELRSNPFSIANFICNFRPLFQFSLLWKVEVYISYCREGLAITNSIAALLWFLPRRLVPTRLGSGNSSCFTCYLVFFPQTPPIVQTVHLAVCCTGNKTFSHLLLLIRFIICSIL